MAKTTKRPGSTTPENDAAAWAAAAKRQPARRCVTCLFMEQTPEAGRWISTVLDLRAAGKCEASLPTILAAIRERWPAYAVTESALRNHYEGCVRHARP